MKILLVQGANLTFLGRREPAIYGTTTAAELDAMLQCHARKHGYVLDIFYSNIEGEAINRIYRAVDEGFDGLVMNPAGFTYAGFALKDCVKGAGLRFVEVLSAILPNAASTASSRTWPRASSPALGCTPTSLASRRCWRSCERGVRNRGLSWSRTPILADRRRTSHDRSRNSRCAQTGYHFGFRPYGGRREHAGKLRSLGKCAGMAFLIHPHMLRHACGYASASTGNDTRAIQAWMWHKFIEDSAYAELAPERFKDFWGRGVLR